MSLPETMTLVRSAQGKRHLIILRETKGIAGESVLVVTFFFEQSVFYSVL